MALINCLECNAKISDKAKSCPKCGIPIETINTKICFECNSVVEKEKGICPSCGIDFSLENTFETHQHTNSNKETSTSKEEPKIKNIPATPIHIKKKSKFLKRVSLTFLILLLIGATGIIILQQQGHNLNSILNTPQTINITATCSEVTNLLLKSETTLTITNSSSNSFDNVTVRVISYDRNNNKIEEKLVSFSRTLPPNSFLSKPVFVSTKTVRCESIVENSSPN